MSYFGPASAALTLAERDAYARIWCWLYALLRRAATDNRAGG